MSMVNRISRLARGDVATFVEIRDDDGANVEATVIVLIVGLAAGLPMLVTTGSIAALLAAIGCALGGWIVLGTVAWLLGARLFHSRASWGGVLRPLGYALLPLLGLVVGVHPVLGVVATLVTAPLTLFSIFNALVGSLQLEGTSTAITTMALPVTAAIIWVLIALATTQVEPDRSGACSGIVDNSGSCIPMEQLSAGLQTQVAREAQPLR